MKKFNINHYIYIQITDYGWKHLEKTVGLEYIKFCIENTKIEINNEIWYKLQMHVVISLFPIIFGGNLFYNTTIMFDDDNDDLSNSKAIADLNHNVINAAMNIMALSNNEPKIEEECSKIIKAVRGFDNSKSFENFEKWLNKKSNQSLIGLPTGYVIDVYNNKIK